MLKRNMGAIDRGARAVFGLVVLSLVFIGPQTPWAWLGLIPLATAVIGYCPAYAPFGLRSCQSGSTRQGYVNETREDGRGSS